VEETQAPPSAGAIPDRVANAPGFKEMAAQAPAAKAAAASCICLDWLRKGSESERFRQY
jgi:hypothetical protein